MIENQVKKTPPGKYVQFSFFTIMLSYPVPYIYGDDALSHNKTMVVAKLGTFDQSGVPLLGK